jgi:FkbM family methyltransferase
VNLLKAFIPNRFKPRLRAWLFNRRWASARLSPKALKGHFEAVGYKAFIEERYVLGPAETDVAEFLAENVWRGYTCIDVGAHFGYYTLLMALYAGESGQVYAFEPQDGARGILERNLAINDLQRRVEALPLVVAEQTGLVPWEDRGFLTTARIGKADGKCQMWKSSTSLDDFFAVRHINPQMIKIDVEGGELGVLRGARQSLADYKPKLVVEVHHSVIGDEGVGELWHLLDSLGYDVFGWRLHIRHGRWLCWFQLSDPRDYVGSHVCALPSQD